MIIVSSCLAGMKVRYNGTACLDETIQKLLDSNQAVAVCPELLGGFSTPREPAEIIGGDGAAVLEGTAKVVDRLGTDVTEMYIKGAYETLEKARQYAATTVVLKENSPSCGSSMIYNGEFSGQKIPGEGVTAALLRLNGIEVISEEQLSARLAL
ncbi:2-thiouracil desulfurase family protein [Paenibacillus sp. BAC0078]